MEGDAPDSAPSPDGSPDSLPGRGFNWRRALWGTLGTTVLGTSVILPITRRTAPAAAKWFPIALGTSVLGATFWGTREACICYGGSPFACSAVAGFVTGAGCVGIFGASWQILSGAAVGSTLATGAELLASWRDRELDEYEEAEEVRPVVVEAPTRQPTGGRKINLPKEEVERRYQEFRGRLARNEREFWKEHQQQRQSLSGSDTDTEAGYRPSQEQR